MESFSKTLIIKSYWAVEQKINVWSGLLYHSRNGHNFVKKSFYKKLKSCSYVLIQYYFILFLLIFVHLVVKQIVAGPEQIFTFIGSDCRYQ